MQQRQVSERGMRLKDLHAGTSFWPLRDLMVISVLEEREDSVFAQHKLRLEALENESMGEACRIKPASESGRLGSKLFPGGIEEFSSRG